MTLLADLAESYWRLAIGETPQDINRIRRERAEEQLMASKSYTIDVASFTVDIDAEQIARAIMRRVAKSGRDPLGLVEGEVANALDHEAGSVVPVNRDGTLLADVTEAVERMMGDGAIEDNATEVAR